MLIFNPIQSSRLDFLVFIVNYSGTDFKQLQGNLSTGDNFDGVPNIDHTQDFVRKDIKEWLIWLQKSVGFQDFRFDFAKGYGKFHLKV